MRLYIWSLNDIKYICNVLGISEDKKEDVVDLSFFTALAILGIVPKIEAVKK